MAISQQIVNSWVPFSGKTGLTRIVKTIMVYDPYTRRSQPIEVSIACEVISRPSRLLAGYDPKGRTIIVYPENVMSHLKTKDIKDARVKTKIYEALCHEVSHIVDPKITKGISDPPMDSSREGTPEEFYNQPNEFDAWCNQISSSVLNECRNSVTEVFDWLRKKDISVLPACFSKMYEDPLKEWAKNPVLIRKFKQRLYNDILCFWGKKVSLPSAKIKTAAYGDEELIELDISQPGLPNEIHTDYMSMGHQGKGMVIVWLYFPDDTFLAKEIEKGNSNSDHSTAFGNKIEESKFAGRFDPSTKVVSISSNYTMGNSRPSGPLARKLRQQFGEDIKIVYFPGARY